jgi:hypothetical protein
MSLAETVLVIGGLAVMGWYVINYVLPNLPGGSPFGGGQFVEGGTENQTATSAGTATPGPFPNNTCKLGNNGGYCYKAVACSTSNPVNGISYRNKSVSWCTKGSCDAAKSAWTSLFKCVNTTPKPAAPAKVLNNPCSGKSGNCTWDCKNAYCWTSAACGKTAKSCTSPGQSANRTTGCNVARNRFLAAYGSCGSGTPGSAPFVQVPTGPCAGMIGQTACTCAATHGACRTGYHGVYSDGKCLCVPNTTTPKPIGTTTGGAGNCPGKSGYCTWDCKNAYCWTSKGPKVNKICISNGTNRTTGCNQARNTFIAYNK